VGATVPAVAANRRRSLGAALVSLLVGVASAGPASAQPFVPTALVADGRIDERAVGAWMDAWFRRRLADPETGAPGAAVAVVEGSRVLLVRGYGFANLERRVAATGATVFRVGSLSKPVTATAVMQLVEAGRVDPRHPVSEYVRDVPLSARLGRPVSVLDLVTHTGGFDVRLEGTAAASDAEVLPLGRYLGDRMPPAARAAGEAIVCSNHGYTLLGRVVEAVSGERFESYVARHIFEPLGMSGSSFRLTPDVERKAAVGYRRGSDGFAPALVVYPHIFPAAGLNTTAEDMARFLVAHLDGGRMAAARILAPGSVAEMHRQQFTMAPGVPGMAFGFFEFPGRGQRALVHGGGIRGFMSGLVIWPDRQVGLFVANNGDSDRLVRDLVADFARRFLPKYTRPSEAREEPERLERFSGAYRPLSATVGSVEKAGVLRGADLEVGVTFRGQLTVGRTRFDGVGGGAFLAESGDGLLWIVERPRGGSPMIVRVDPVNGVVPYERVPWYATARCHREVLYACVAVFVSVLAAAARLAGRRLSGAASAPVPRGAVAARGLLALITTMNLLSLVLIVAAFRSPAGAGMLFGLPEMARVALRVNLVAACLGAPLVAGLWAVWRASGWPAGTRAHFTVGVAACLAFAAWAWHWNLLG
jgi:CubicO group peptidase (beta-lactamase class C family)